MIESLRAILKPAVIVGCFSLIALGLVSQVHDRTADRIAANERQALLGALNELIAPGSYDNDLLAESSNVTDSLLGSDQPLPIYRARKKDQAVAVALSAVAPDGYSGTIRLLVAVRADQTLAGVRVLSHKETPGLGDLIEIPKSDWILSFKGCSLQNPAEHRWKVKKDGGDFDQFSGATITPRAVVGAVKRVLIYVRHHHLELFVNPGNLAPERSRSSRADRPRL